MLLSKGYRVHGASRDAEALHFGNLMRPGHQKPGTAAFCFAFRFSEHAVNLDDGRAG